MTTDADAGDSLIDRLLGAHAATFDQAIWRRRFLALPGAATGLLPGMPAIAAVRAHLGGDVIDEASARPFASFPRAGAPPFRRWLRGPIDRPDPADAVNLPQAERLFPSLRPLARALGRRFAAPTNLQLFLSRDGAGLGPHTDLHDSFVIQIAGRKRWRIEDPIAGQLREGNGGGAFGPAAVDLELGPGDALYKPSHGLHATAAGDGESLSLTASIVTLTAADALARYITALTSLDPIWLTRLPASGADEAALDEALAGLPLPRASDLRAALAGGDDEDDEAGEDG